MLRGIVKSPFEPLQEASLCLLTLKTVFLVPITTTSRVRVVDSSAVREPFLRNMDDANSTDRSKFHTKKGGISFLKVSR